jgi:hypothetical protein
VWDETGKLPLDSAVYYLPVGGPSKCDHAAAAQRASINLLKVSTERDVEADVQLLNFEFPMNNGASNSASFMVLRTQEGNCSSYGWSSEGTVSGLVLNNTVFKKQLQDARLAEGFYASVAQQLRDAVFPPAMRLDAKAAPCGADAAWADLKKIANNGRTRVFARFTDRHGQLQTVPLALLALAEHDGAPLFANDLTVIEPLPRETLDPTSCVSAWTFVLPETLHGLGEVAIPPWAAGDSRVLRSKIEFRDKFLAAENTSDPQGLLVLAHHEQGLLQFTRTNDSLTFLDFKRTIGDGSIAVLSACETSKLDDNAQLITRLNSIGVDALVTSPFVVDARFGSMFAANFATVVHELEQEMPIEAVFREALRRTSEELKHSRGEVRARGMGLEFVLVGNPKVRICPPQ